MMRQYELVERVLAYDPEADENLLNRAYVYAMKAHANQQRASGDPYFSHPLEVAAILTDLHLDGATIATALLHDVIEDTDATRSEIDELFGPEIGKLVDGLTKIKRIDLVTKITGVSFEEAWSGRVAATLDGLPVPILGRDALLKNKRATGRAKDQADVEALVGD